MKTQLSLEALWETHKHTHTHAGTHARTCTYNSPQPCPMTENTIHLI